MFKPELHVCNTYTIVPTFALKQQDTWLETVQIQKHFAHFVHQFAKPVQLNAKNSKTIIAKNVLRFVVHVLKCADKWHHSINS
jgi:hypothetical protein